MICKSLAKLLLKIPAILKAVGLDDVVETEFIPFMKCTVKSVKSLRLDTFPA